LNLFSPRIGLLGLTAGLALGAGCASYDSGLGAPGALSPLSGQTRSRTFGPLVPQWRTQLSQPTVFREVRHQFGGVAHDPSGDRVAVVMADGDLYCLKASNGDVLWRVKLGGGGGGHAYFKHDRLYLGTDDGRMMALRAEDGRKIWSYRVQGAIQQGPVFDGERMYFVDGQNAIYALKHKTGEWLWQYRRDVPAEFALMGEARPVVADGKVYLGFSDGILVSLNAADGAVAWQRDLAPEHDRFQDIDAPIAIIGKRLFAASSAAGVYALEVATGEIVWNVPITGAVQLIAHDEDIIIGLESGQMARLRGLDGFMQWRTRFGRSAGAPGAPVLLDNDLAVAFSNGGLHTLSADDGRPINQFTPGNGIHAPLTVASDGRLFFVSDGGVLYAFARFGGQ
jgi:outer membrane protein assembly factor BamB